MAKSMRPQKLQIVNTADVNHLNYAKLCTEIRNVGELCNCATMDCGVLNVSMVNASVLNVFSFLHTSSILRSLCDIANVQQHHIQKHLCTSLAMLALIAICDLN